MEFISNWIQGIIVAVIIATIIEMILPNGTSKKYIKVVIGIYVLFSIISPIIEKFAKKDIDINEVINFEKYENSLTYKTSANLSKDNEKQIKQIYVEKMKEDMKSKLREKGFLASDIKVKVANEYEIEKLEIKIAKMENKEENEQSHINKIEIRVAKQEKKENIQNISEKEIKEIKEYINTIYQIKENDIYITKEEE